MRTVWILGVGAVVGVAPVTYRALQALAARDYAGAALLVASAAILGRLGPGLLALSAPPGAEDA